MSNGGWDGVTDNRITMNSNSNGKLLPRANGTMQEISLKNTLTIYYKTTDKDIY